MEDFLFLSFCELIVFLYFWPRMAEKTTDWSIRCVQRDNPHLRICFYARKWITPALFVVLTLMAMFIGLDLAKEFLEIVILNALVVMTALTIGAILSQLVIDHYIAGRKKYF